MAQTFATFKRSFGIITKEPAKLVDLGSSSSVTNTRSSEIEVIAKIDNILSYLKVLEQNFLKSKQDLLKKSTLEGRENNKICAVQGKLISNMTKYYQNLEQDIDALSQTLKNSFDKITREFKQLQFFSKPKTETTHSLLANSTHIPNPNSTRGSPIQRAATDVKPVNINFPTIKSSKSGDMKVIIDTNKDRPLLPFSLKVKSAEAEPAPKKVNFERCENLTNGPLMKLKIPHHISSSLAINKIDDLTSKSPVNSADGSNINDLALFDSPCNLGSIKSKFAADEKNRSTSSGSLSDSNIDISDNDEELLLKSKKGSSCFDDEVTVLSLDGSINFKF